MCRSNEPGADDQSAAIDFSAHLADLELADRHDPIAENRHVTDLDASTVAEVERPSLEKDVRFERRLGQIRCQGEVPEDQDKNDGQ